MKKDRMETQPQSPPPAAAPAVQPLALAVETVAPPSALLGVALQPYALARKLLFHQILEGLATLKQEPQVTLQSWLFFRVLSMEEAALMQEAFRPAEFLRATLDWAGHFDDPEADDAVFALYLDLSKKRGRGHGAGTAATAAAGNATAAPDGGGPVAPLGD
jgi:hypothetical protein